MTRITGPSSFALLAALLAGLIAPSAGHAQVADCNWYADTALKQQQRNEQGKCGFRGDDWSSKRPAHLAWCATQSPDRWKAAAQKREQQLAGCKK